MADESKTAPPVPGAGQGLSGPNPTPSYGNRPQESGNKPVVTQEERDSFVEGAAAASTFHATDELIAAASAGEEHEGTTQYASPSIARLKVGPFQFENGVLRIPNDQVERFEKLLSHAALRTRQAISKIDRKAGEAVARRFIEQTKGKTTTGVDTSASIAKAPNPSDPDNQPNKPPSGVAALANKG